MTYHEFMREAGRIYLEAALKHAGNATRAARLVGLNRTYFYKAIDRHGAWYKGSQGARKFALYRGARF